MNRCYGLTPLLVALLLITLSLAWTAFAQTPPVAKSKPTAPSIDVLAAVLDADPLELARIAQRLGDTAVLARLAETRETEVRLAAIRATPYLREPERALSLLVPIISGRDTLLAQAAARSAITIARVLDVDQLQRREMPVSDLAPVRASLERAAAIEHLRPDLRAIVTAVAAMLAGLGVPLPS